MKKGPRHWKERRRLAKKVAKVTRSITRPAPLSEAGNQKERTKRYEPMLFPLGKEIGP